MENKITELAVEQRRNRIIEIITDENMVRVGDLSSRFEISEVTIRNDLAELEKAGHLNRVRGGAVSTNKSYIDMSILERLSTHEAEKKKIAAYIASIVNQGDTLFINSGTTSIYVAKEIKNIRNLFIVTNSILIAQELNSSQNSNVILLGGNIEAQYQFTYGDDTVEQLAKYRADKFIFTCDGISAKAGITTYHPPEFAVNKAFIKNTNSTVCIADYSKIGKVSRIRLGGIDTADTLVTNQNANEKEVALMKKSGLEIILV